jgi:cytochrome c oxidase cbb3-type subunit I/II
MGRSSSFIIYILPDWAQSLGVVFSVMLIAPSWGGMINGLLTLRGAWDKVREDVA